MSQVAHHFVSELQQLWRWLCAVRPIRVLISSSDDDMRPERRLLTRRLDELRDVDVLAIENEATIGVDGPDRQQWIRWAVGQSDVVLFFADNPGSSARPEAERFRDFTHLLTELSMARALRKRRLAYSLARPFTDDEALLPYWEGDLASLRARFQTGVTEDSPSDSMSWVLMDRNRRMIRDVWRGEISTVEGLDRRIVTDVERAATRLRWFRRGWRFLALAAFVILAGWLVVRFGLIGALFVIAITGIGYLWTLDRRWRQPELWWQ